MKARDAFRTGFLRYWIAQLTLGTGAEMSEADAIKKMRGVLKEAKSGITTFSPEEVALIREWVPPTLTPDQIAEALAPVAEQIKAAPKEGMAMGIAMKALGRPAGRERRRQGRDRRLADVTRNDLRESSLEAASLTRHGGISAPCLVRDNFAGIAPLSGGRWSRWRSPPGRSR